MIRVLDVTYYCNCSDTGPRPTSGLSDYYTWYALSIRTSTGVTLYKYSCRSVTINNVTSGQVLMRVRLYSGQYVQKLTKMPLCQQNSPGRPGQHRIATPQQVQEASILR